VDADSVQGSIALGVHGLEFSVVMAPPEEGGRIRISYSEWRVKEGNTMRLAFIEQVLKKLGFHTEVNNGQYLSAILDKSHGAGDQREIERALFLAVRAIYYTPDLNLMFDSVIGVKRQRSERQKRKRWKPPKRNSVGCRMFHRGRRFPVLFESGCLLPAQIGSGLRCLSE
jgi:hypothetical protein